MTLLPTSDPVNVSNEDVYGNQTKPNDTCRYDDPLRYTVIPVYILIITVLGIVFNVFVLMVFCLHKKPCTVAEIYLGNLAAADLLLMSFLPFWAQNAANKMIWPFSNGLCKLASSVILMNAYTSIYFLVLISIDRYLALVHPLSHDKMRRPFCAKLVCILVWGLGLILSIPSFIYREVVLRPKLNVSTCNFVIPNPNLYDIIMSMLTFIFPICMISFFTLKILKALSNRVTEGMSLNSRTQELKATVLVLSVLLAFLVCWVPYHVLKILNVLGKVGILGGCQFKFNLGLCRQIFTYFAFFNSVLNPILYVIVGKNFRKKAEELFKQCGNKRKSSISLMSTRTYRSRSVKTEEALC